MTIKTEELKTYILKNKNGYQATLTNYGGRLMDFLMPDKSGKWGNIILGYDTPDEYIGGNEYFSPIVGRFANRIQGGKFSLDGKEIQLEQNSGSNHLHGGSNGLHKKIWDTIEFNETEARLILQTESLEDEDRYPGNVKIQASFCLTEQNELEIEFKAQADKKTILNLTYHPFFNLKDGGKSNIGDHILHINATGFTPTDENQIPTGEIAELEGTPLDFGKPMAVGMRINENFKQLELGSGYDHNYVLDKKGKKADATLLDPQTGRKMEIFTTEPGIQFYSGNFLDGSDKGKGGTCYQRRTGLCLEPQHFPNSPNIDHFPSVELNTNEEYYSKTIYKFSVEQ